MNTTAINKTYYYLITKETKNSGDRRKNDIF